MRHLYSGFSTLGWPEKGGKTRAPCLMHWPGGRAGPAGGTPRNGVQRLFYYGVENHQPDAMNVPQGGRTSSRKPGLTCLPRSTASRPDGHRDFIDRPVYNI
ncbi:MAG: hypothetical protein Ct9H300mP1_34960 [Planctomycetaceae bacterium]|nr:MAG: hypothetical protein Ct9H300mP1_34960 [Planctomycetaceae bacterium]